MEYKGYVAKIEYDESASSLHGYVANSGPYSIANFYGNDVAELKREFAASVDAYLASCEEDAVDPTKPHTPQGALALIQTIVFAVYERVCICLLECGSSPNVGEMPTAGRGKDGLSKLWCQHYGGGRVLHPVRRSLCKPR